MAKLGLQSHRELAASVIVLILCCLYSFGSIQSIPEGFRNLFSLPLECENPNYTVRLLSYDPLMIHIENFLTVKERAHMIQLASNRLERSKVRGRNGTLQVSEGRTSKTAIIPPTDHIATCVLRRVSEFQGYEPLENIEPLQVTAYQQGEQIRKHFDWQEEGYHSNVKISRNRATTFFGILEADCDDCETQFTHLRADWESKDDKWCHFVNCTSEQLRVKPVAGSALFWRNLHLDGTGDRRTEHAGLPLSRGFKTGLNVWTWEDV